MTPFPDAAQNDRLANPSVSDIDGVSDSPSNALSGGLLKDWSQFSARRTEMADALKQMSTLLSQAEVTSAEESGQLSLSASIHEIQQAANSLNKGTYRLMVMGDMKRGKSTLLNALIGENLLPSDVNPCTALLTTLRYGPKKQITLHFKDVERSPEIISLETFKTDYTIDPTESKRLESEGEEAFPDIAQVVVDYPLPLLEQGLELIDTPGLNDTEARNDQVLSYLGDAQAVLFVLDATQPFTLDEQRYLNNYLKDSGLALFFIVNGWDRIQSGLVNPEDSDALATAEANVRSVFQNNLQPYATTAAGESRDLRLFEVSALQALRQRLKGQPLEQSGFAYLLNGLDHFLAHERGPAELQRALSVAGRAYRSVSTSVSRRIPLLDETLETLQEKVVSVESDFTKLEEIRDRYRKVIHTSRDINAKTISSSFKQYILGLESTFEDDFSGSQPDLEFLDFLESSKRQEFYTAFKRAFERYINDRLAAWEFTAKQTIGTAFDDLNANAVEYQVEYAEVVEVIHEKLMGRRFYAVANDFDPKKAKVWVDSVKDVFEDIPDNLNNAVRPFNGFWQSVMQSALAYVCIVIALQLLGVIFSSLFLNVIGVIMAAGGIFAVQAEFVRQEFLKATKKEFVKQLPRIAEEQTPNIRRAVMDCFTAYEERAIDRISNDISARKGELTNLVEQKQQHEINREQEVERLEQLEKQVQENVSAIESMVGRSL
ncbi:MAG: dynamin family protein [Cyanobacteria bacterium J06560_2]